MRKIELVCLDVDGTLVGQDLQVHPRVWAAAEPLRQAGIHLAICTGRPGLGATRDFAVQLSPTGWHIFQGGASLLNLGGAESRSHPLSASALQALKNQQSKTGWVLELYSDQDYVCNQPLDGSPAAAMALAHAELIGLEYQPRSLDSLQGELVRAQWVVSDAQLAPVLAQAVLDLNYAPATSPSVPGVHFVSVTAPGVDKCSAIQTLAEEVVGCSLAQTMMVGDGLNDVSALKMVGYPVAMANAHPDLTAISAYQVGHVDLGGAADALILARQIIG